MHGHWNYRVVVEKGSVSFREVHYNHDTKDIDIVGMSAEPSAIIWDTVEDFVGRVGRALSKPPIDLDTLVFAKWEGIDDDVRHVRPKCKRNISTTDCRSARGKTALMLSGKSIKPDVCWECFYREMMKADKDEIIGDLHDTLQDAAECQRRAETAEEDAAHMYSEIECRKNDIAELTNKIAVMKDTAC